MKNGKYTHLFTDNIRGTDLASFQLINKLNKGIRFLSYVTDIFSNYTWVASLKDKIGITITIAFQQILDEQTKKNMAG